MVLVDFYPHKYSLSPESVDIQTLTGSSSQHLLDASTSVEEPTNPPAHLTGSFSDASRIYSPS